MQVRGIVKCIAVFGVVVGLGIVFAGQPTYAATPQTITMTPSSATLAIDPGASVSTSVDVINTGTTDYKVTLTSSPYHVEGSDYNPKFTQIPGTIDASQWIHFTQPTVDQTVSAHKLYSFDYTISVPENTAPGGYYAVIFAETNATENQSTGVATHNRVGEILYLTVNGKVKLSGHANFNNIPFITALATISLTTSVVNDGGVHFSTAATTTIKNLFGSVVYTSKTDRYVLPQTQRDITTTWSPHTPITLFDIERSATLPNGTTQQSSQWVLVISPWVIWLMIAMIVLIVVTVIIRIWKRRAV